MEGRLRRIILGLVAAAALLVAYLFMHLGVSKPVLISLEKRGPYEFLFKNHLGAYHKIVGVIQDVEKWAAERNLSCPQTFGEYLDDPQGVDEDRLRSHGGCILKARLDSPPPDMQTQSRPERLYAVGRFEGSPAIGPLKVYPKIRQFLIEHRLTSASPVIEIYTVNGSGMTTEYLFAIDNPPHNR